MLKPLCLHITNNGFNLTKPNRLMKNNILFLVFLAFALASPQAFSQGVTTSAISGNVIDDAGEVVPMANVVVMKVFDQSLTSDKL